MLIPFSFDIRLRGPVESDLPVIRTTLHLFPDSEGVGVQTGLIFDTLGNLYGATESEVFVLKRDSHGDWTESVAYAFGPSDGGNIYGDLVFDQQGNLYGSNLAGGVDGAVRCSNWLKTPKGSGPALF